MNSKILKYIEKELNLNNELVIRFIPTLEECDYLLSKGYSVTKKTCFFKGISGNDWTSDYSLIEREENC